MFDLQRRRFITLIGGAAAAWPMAARAQTQQAVRAIGYISSRSVQADAHLLAAFRSGLKEAGYVDGQNVNIEFRWAEGDYARHEALAADLVRQKVAVIFAASAPTATAAKKVPRGAIPLVFTSGEDPVKEGLVDSFNRPGGDTTGIYVFTVGLGPKRLEIRLFLEIPCLLFIFAACQAAFAKTKQEYARDFEFVVPGVLYAAVGNVECAAPGCFQDSGCLRSFLFPALR